MNIKSYENIIKAQAGVLYLKGRPGSAKSAIVKSIADKNNWKFIDLRLSQLASEDLAGIPRPVKQDNGMYVTEWSLPKLFVTANDQPTLIMFDELNRSTEPTLNASLQILNERTLGTEFKFNDNVYMVAAGNLGEEDGTEVIEFDSALNNRLIHVNHILEFSDWKTWAEKDNHVIPEVVAFLEARPGKIFESSENSDASASYRSWTNLSTYLKSVLGDSYTSQDMVKEIVEVGFSFIGTGAMAFSQYVEETASVSVNDIVENWDGVKKIVIGSSSSRKSGLIHDFAEYSLSKTNKTQKNNIVSFLKECQDDEVVFLIIKWLESSDDDSFLAHIKTIINTYDPSDKFRQSILESME